MSIRKSKKYCIVPKCSSTLTNTPEKLFFYVPLDPETRKIWMQVMKRADPPGAKSSVYCCEDHFDIESDMENYIKYKLVGGKLKLKKGIVPHKFECQESVNKTPESVNPDSIHSVAILKTEMLDLPIKLELVPDSDGDVPLPRMGPKQECSVLKTEPVEDNIWEVPVMPDDIKCEYEADPEHDDELRRISLEQRLKSEPAERNIEEDSVASHQKAADNSSGEKREARGASPDKRHQCNLCHKHFSSFSYLKTHIKTQHTAEKPYKCNDCQKRFKTLGNLKSHQRTHTGEKPYECDICRKCFSASGSLNEHYRTHTGEKPFECTRCEKRFTKMGSLKKHLRTHTGEKPYECSICKKRFALSGTLRSHSVLHTGEKPYKCDICSRRFAQRGSIKTHLKTHTDEKQYECNLCKRQFVYQHAFILHSRLHTGEKPYECNLCMRRFVAKKNLKIHVRNHSGEKLHKCSVCQKCFAHSATLKNHLIIHTGDKPHGCSLCGKRFARKHYLRSHLRSHARRSGNALNQ